MRKGDEGMSIHENDPRNIAYAALCIAITWYKFIPSDAALRIARGKSSAKPGVKPTPEVKEQIKKVMENPGFKSFDAVERKYKVNRYEIITSEEEYAMAQVEMWLKRLKEHCQACTADKELCKKCKLFPDITEGFNMCEFFLDVDIENPKILQGEETHKNAQKRTTELLSGETQSQGIRLYKKLDKEIKEYVTKKGIKKQDFINLALAEKIARCK
jgi:predicted DNA binding CopG/RHH family protein